MIWTDKQLESGQLIASQTTNFDFKDVSILCMVNQVWTIVSLLDGYSQYYSSYTELLAHLNKFHFVPIAKLIGSGVLPENRIGLPAVQITGLRKSL